ncbi:pectate lyase, partial [Streptomyces sp. TRM76130]|nr:pectate lyase [Streptomyces sp. TRM76130]
GSGKAANGSAVTSYMNNWDSGVATPAFRSTDATTVYNARGSDGALPATTFLTTGSTTIGATMD